MGYVRRTVRRTVSETVRRIVPFGVSGVLSPWEGDKGEDIALVVPLPPPAVPTHQLDR